MVKPRDGEQGRADVLADKTVEELLLLIGDQDLGYRFEAMDRVLSLGFDAVYPTLESAVRNDANADLRNGAMEALVRFGHQSVPALIALLRDDNEEVRNFSAVMLGDIASREALYPLIDALADPDVNVSHAAAEALGKIGDDAALLPLIQLLKGDFWLQYPAVVAMGEMGDWRAVPHLIPLLEDEMLREPAITALGRIGDERALPYLAEILCNKQGKAVAATARAIVVIVEKGGEAVKALLPSLVDSRGIDNLLQYLADAGNDKGDAVLVLGLLGEKAAVPTLLTLLEEHDYEQVVTSSIMAMEPAVPLLAEGLLRQSHRVQTVVLGLLRELQAKVPVDHLLMLFGQGGPEVQLSVLASLVGKTEPEVLHLVEQLLDDGSRGRAMKEAAALVYSQFPPETVGPFCTGHAQSAHEGKRAVAALVAGHAAVDVLTEVLLALLLDPDASVRQEAVKAAGRWQKTSFVPALLTCLDDSDGVVRREALFSLTEYGAAMPVAAILERLGRQDERLDYEIIMAMGRTGSNEAEAALVDYLEEGGVAAHLEFAVIETLGKIGSRGGKGWVALCRYLCHEEPDIRRLAVQALAHIGGTDFIPELADASRDRHWSVRAAALQGLGQSESPQAIPVIAAALGDPDILVRRNAVAALTKEGNVLAMPELATYLADPELGKPVGEALYVLGHSNLPTLHAMARMMQPLELRQRLVSIIGKYTDPLSTALLVDLAKNDSCEEIRTAASHALVLGGQAG